MKTRYRLIRRGVRGGGFYCVDNKTGKRTSLRTASEGEARQIVEAKNQAERQPVLNLQIAKAYLAGTDNGINTPSRQRPTPSKAQIKTLENRRKDGLSRCCRGYH
jgi:hypothetical protein